MASELLHMELRTNLVELDMAYAKGEITAAEYLSASLMIEERIDFLIDGEIREIYTEERYDS